MGDTGDDSTAAAEGSVVSWPWIRVTFGGRPGLFFRLAFSPEEGGVSVAGGVFSVDGVSMFDCVCSLSKRIFFGLPGRAAAGGVSVVDGVSMFACVCSLSKRIFFGLPGRPRFFGRCFCCSAHYQGTLVNCSLPLSRPRFRLVFISTDAFSSSLDNFLWHLANAFTDIALLVNVVAGGNLFVQNLAIFRPPSSSSLLHNVLGLLPSNPLYALSAL